jgi:hypothetical protein
MTDDAALYMWTIYDHPRDKPDKFVARCWRIARGQDPQATSMFLYPVIVETWL